MSTYAESTKRRIVQFVITHPGHKGGEIASSLGLDKSRVNSFLYSEGKRRFGLQQSNWRWSASGVDMIKPDNTRNRRSYGIKEIPPEHPPASRVVPINSICGSLNILGVTDATLKIRGMNEHQINLTFAEDEYALLDERLQAELAIRRSELLNAKPVKAESKSHFTNPLLLIALGLMAVILLGNAMNNTSSERLHQRQVPSSIR